MVQSASLFLGMLWGLGGLGHAAAASAIDLGHWIVGSPAPTKRTEVAVAQVGGIIYVVGGFVKPTLWNFWKITGSDLVEAYDPVADRWMMKSPLPLPVHHAGAAELNGKLYIVGGFTQSGGTIWHAVSTVFEYTPDTGSWRTRAPMPTARGGLGVVAVAGRLYAIGGFDGETNPPAVEVYDPQTDSWTTAASLPTPRDHLAAVAVADRIYAIGGRKQLDYTRNLATVEEYDPDRDQWVAKTPMPTARSGIAAGVIGEWIYVVGGESDAGTFDTNERYSPRLDKWETMAPLPTARHGLGVAVVRQRLYVLSGGPTPGGSYSNANEIFFPPGHAHALPALAGLSRRTPAKHVGAVMAMLALFDKAHVLPPQSSPEADHLIRVLIQFQAVLVKHAEPAVRQEIGRALQAYFGNRTPAVLDALATTGWTSEILEALVEYTETHPLWTQPALREALALSHVTPEDWNIIRRTFLDARRQLAARGENLHALYARLRREMPGGSAYTRPPVPSDRPSEGPSN
ncbi:MAG: kelch repeat-containing protein [Nitrospirae bacterium]|nr:MAG: kelch repeat-containing protein [Nitrospirota bacterium]